MIEKNINNEEINVEELLQALTFEGEREIKSTHKFPPFLFKSFHVFRQNEETRKKIMEEVNQIKEMHSEDEDFYGKLLLSCYLTHLTDLPTELVTVAVLDKILAKPNRQFSMMIASVIEEMSETMAMDVIQVETSNVLERVKKLG